MTRAEMREVTIQFQSLPNFVLRMIMEHPNQCAEYAANELIVRRIRNTKNVAAHSVKV